MALRHAVLRPGWPRDAAAFRGDEDPDTLHFGAFTAGGETVGCLTLIRRDADDVPAFQLRGMATAESHRGQHVGAALIRFAEQFVLEHTDVRHLWCNARCEAHGFYLRQGWHIASEAFMVETVGLHFRMTKSLDA